MGARPCGGPPLPPAAGRRVGATAAQLLHPLGAPCPSISAPYPYPAPERFWDHPATTSANAPVACGPCAPRLITPCLPPNQRAPPTQCEPRCGAGPLAPHAAMHVRRCGASCGATPSSPRSHPRAGVLPPPPHTHTRPRCPVAHTARLDAAPPARSTRLSCGVGATPATPKPTQPCSRALLRGWALAPVRRSCPRWPVLPPACW